MIRMIKFPLEIWVFLLKDITQIHSQITMENVYGQLKKMKQKSDIGGQISNQIDHN